MNRYQPGQSIRFSVTVTALGILTNPTSLTLVLQPPGSGSQVVFSTPTNDTPGAYHQDYVLPGNATQGTWLYRWTSTGGPPQQNGVIEGQFLVAPLSF